MAVSSAINGGNLYQPYIVKAILEPETNSVIKENKKKLVRKTISVETSKIVRETLESVVANGTGRNSYIAGYRVGGKTGTAQKVANGKYLVGNYILSFIGFAPADDPKIVVYVAVDNPKGVVQYGGTVAAPIAKEVILEAMRVFDIKKRDDGMDKEWMWPEVKSHKIPNVVGLSKEEATKELTLFNVKYSGSGDIVVLQTPSAKETLKEGGTVRLLLGK